jgi:hypothetical protein
MARITWIKEFVNGGLLSIGKMADGNVVTCAGFHLDKEIRATSLFKSAQPKKVEKSNIRDAGIRRSIIADDYGPQRFCACCEAKLSPVYGNMDSVPSWEHPDNVEKIAITFINKKGKEVQKKKKIKGRMEVQYEVENMCTCYSKGHIVDDDDVVSMYGNHKHLEMKDTFKLFWKMKKTHRMWKAAHELVELAKKFKETKRIKDITVPMAESYLSSLTKIDKKNANWFVKNKDILQDIYSKHSDDAGALPTEVEDSTTMSANQLYTLRKMTYLAKGLNSKSHITERKDLKTGHYEYPGKTRFNEKAVYTMFRNLISEGRVEFSNDEERSYWNELCQINQTHQAIQYKKFNDAVRKAAKNNSSIEELSTITCEEVCEFNY